MARPEEKANAMMNKWVKMRDAGNKPASGFRSKRPHLASECNNLNDAERFRRQLLREITELVSKIQNPGLGEHVIRDTNDDINKKMREKHHWNKRIKTLGGPDFTQLELKQQLENANPGDTIVGSGGYRYYGAAKDLPGVRELFEERQKQKQKKRHNVYKHITPDYYGWREEEDGVLLELEAEVTREAKRQKLLPPIDDTAPTNEEVLSQEAISKALLEKRKKELLSRFM